MTRTGTVTTITTYHSVYSEEIINRGSCPPSTNVTILLLTERLRQTLTIIKPIKGGATIVQGAIVQGDNCPRDSCPSRQFSKETIVQGDYCPRGSCPMRLLSKEDFCPRKTFVQEDKYSYFCPRNFCYRNEEKNCWEQTKINKNFLLLFLKCGVRPTYGFFTPPPPPG